MRVASLLPSATEIVCALGFQEALVARSHECDYPPGVEALPSCTAARIDDAATSREIDDRVSELPTDRPIVVYCRTGQRSLMAARAIASLCAR